MAKDIRQQAISDLMLKRISREQFLGIWGATEASFSAEVQTLIQTAITNQDADAFDDATFLEAYFGYAHVDVHLLLTQTWHHQHEDFIGLLQHQKSPASVPALKAAIALKPQLAYLDYDDYGAYYKKCLWALAAIGTPEAIAVIRECVSAEDEQLREEAVYRLHKLEQSD